MEEPVQAYIQLRRPSDGATSEARHFQYLPLDSGSSVEASFNCNPHFMKKRVKPDFQLYTKILAIDAAVLARQMFSAADNGNQLSHDVSNASVQCENDDFPIAKSVSFSDASDSKDSVSVDDSISQSNSINVSKVDAVPAQTSSDVPPPIPEKGAGFAKLKGKLVKDGQNGYNEREMKQAMDFHRASLSTILSESDPRFSLASSEDLNSRLSAAFSDYSDLTDIHSIYSEVDISDVLSLISSTHTLNDRLSQFEDNDSDSTDSEQTVIDGSKSETSSIDTIEKQLEMLQSMSVESDNNTYSSFQMAMKYPFPGWPIQNQTPNHSTLDIQNDLVYDDPSDEPYKLVEYALPTAPPRTESMTTKIPPLPPRRFKKLNQPLPNTPNKDMGLKNALQAIKQSFKKTKPVPVTTSPPLQNVSEEKKDTVEKRESETRECSLDSKTVCESEVYEAPEFPMDGHGSNCGSVTTIKELITTDPSDNLTEAENYALYMTLAPLATASEFDEAENLSMLYADLNSTREAVKILERKALK